jgi:MoaE-MoaD fusion protein
MRVRVQLFASLRERAGARELELELPEGALVGDALEQMKGLTEGIPVAVAVNQEYADVDAMLHRGDEVALIPPISGGSLGTIHARVTASPLSVEGLTGLVADPRAGAVVTFVGAPRDVELLEYEAYVLMAERKIAEIVARATERHGLCSAAAEHRLGTVPLSEPSVVVAVSAPHREQAFAGAREIVDEIKAQAPIWKKEEGEWAPGVRPG